jgi:glutamate dehydrogenase (NADP+)
MTQNSMRLSWPREEVDARLCQIMKSIHEACIRYGLRHDGTTDYVVGANVAGFIKVADAMLDQGLV